jgi:type III restriction enzyme
MTARARRVNVAPETTPVQPVDRPILNSPYVEPNRHWQYAPGEPAPDLKDGRRSAGYYYMTRRVGAAQLQMFADPERDDLQLVNRLRADVKRWRESDYPGAEQVTRTLLRHWSSSDLARRLFFCQREAVETIVYLREILDANRTLPWRKLELTRADYERLNRNEVPGFVDERRASWHPRLIDLPEDGAGPLVRYGCKMATGSGKTVVMAMLIAWSFCNRGRRPADRRFADAVLVVCPNLTIKERLQVLRPEQEDNYFEQFDLVPSSLLTELRKGRVLVENWHRFLPESPHAEGGATYKVVNKGEEGPEAFGRRVLGDLYDRGPIMVLNDEAHHAHRPPPGDSSDAEDTEATIWVGGLDRLQRGVGISFCVDLSATPFYIASSGHTEGAPFPWIVSDFGLVDAIESGIVKIPRLPVADTTGRPEPKFYALWRHIADAARSGERIHGKPKPQVVWREAEAALRTLASQWKAKFEVFKDNAGPDSDPTPPVLIIVCDNTDTADLFFRKISGEEEREVDESGDQGDAHAASAEEGTHRRRRGKTIVIAYGSGAVFPELLSNTTDEPLRTIRIDTKLLAEAEARFEVGSRADAAEHLREIVATVGQAGKPGAQVRCVVSVQMLSEGWDANNVTHVLGLRAFGSQLLCEQVVGRGLRRMDYVPDPETGLLTEEYVDIYGVPFSLLPFRGRDPNRTYVEPPPQRHVYALPERAHLMIRFPVVEGYTIALKRYAITADVNAMEPLRLDPVTDPRAVFVKPQIGTAPGQPGLGGFQAELQDRREYYESTHLQTIEFEIAREVLGRLLEAQDGRGRGAAHLLYPQVFRIVRDYVDRRIDFRGMDPREVGLERYAQAVATRVFTAIRPDEEAGEGAILPLLNRYRPIIDTSRVDFKTIKPCFGTQKSHLNLVAADTSSWEQAAAFQLEASGDVLAYARNDHLDFSIPYEFQGLPRSYFPDYLARLADRSNLVIEVKGQTRPEDLEKHEAARRWVAAVNAWGKLGKWAFLVCKDPQLLGGQVRELTAKIPA